MFIDVGGASLLWVTPLLEFGSWTIYKGRKTELSIRTCVCVHCLFLIWIAVSSPARGDGLSPGILANIASFPLGGFWKSEHSITGQKNGPRFLTSSPNCNSIQKIILKTFILGYQGGLGGGGGVEVLALKAVSLTLIPRTHILEGENWFFQVVLWCLFPFLNYQAVRFLGVFVVCLFWISFGPFDFSREGLISFQTNDASHSILLKVPPVCVAGLCPTPRHPRCLLLWRTCFIFWFIVFRFLLSFFSLCPLSWLMNFYRISWVVLLGVSALFSHVSVS